MTRLSETYHTYSRGRSRGGGGGAWGSMDPLDFLTVFLEAPAIGLSFIRRVHARSFVFNILLDIHRYVASSLGLLPLCSAQ